jgi:L-aspartate oxidase
LPDEVVVVGGGLAGLFTALKLAPIPVTVITSARLGWDTASSWAQGGIAAAVGEKDHPRKHAHDTMDAAAGTADASAVEVLTNEAANRIGDLLALGVPFDVDADGILELSREAAHSARRIVRVKGDSAGAAIMKTLAKKVRKTPSVRVLEGLSVKQLVCDNGKVIGVNAWPGDADGIEAPLFLAARAIVLAAGGIGGLYAVTTNPRQANGEALAMAANAGAIIADAEFVQFHPTAINVKADPAPLATEALRGEGGLLIDDAGYRFMEGVHPDYEMAPRDIVARAVYNQVISNKGAWLDCRQAIGERFANKFPTVYSTCMAAGINPALEPIPVVVAEHYHMGGVLTDANGRTSVENLWACGEVASTGVHGANRLASNSLLEAVVFANRVSNDIAASMPQISVPAGEFTPVSGEFCVHPASNHVENATITRLRKLMSDKVGVIRNREGLLEALQSLKEMRKQNSGNLTLQNMATAAEIIAAAALAREESRGSHYRSDFPESRPEMAVRSNFTLAQIRHISGR